MIMPIANVKTARLSNRDPGYAKATHVSLSNGFPCLLATNSPPNTLYTLLSEETGVLSPPSLTLVAESVAANSKLTLISWTVRA